MRREAYENYTKFCTRGKRDLGYDIQDGEKTVEEHGWMVAGPGDTPKCLDITEDFKFGKDDLKISLCLLVLVGHFPHGSHMYILG